MDKAIPGHDYLFHWNTIELKESHYNYLQYHMYISVVWNTTSIR